MRELGGRNGRNKIVEINIASDRASDRNRKEDRERKRGRERER